MPASQKATRINLFSLATPQMRAFHLTWLAFFVCFFAWFAVAPLMPIIRGEFKLTPDQIANINIAAIGITIIARMAIGPLCATSSVRGAPTRRCSRWVRSRSIGIAFAQNPMRCSSFFRLAIGIIGASFVITQFHTSVMFAPNVVGTANATVGGWGNAGGGVTQIASCRSWSSPSSALASRRRLDGACRHDPARPSLMLIVAVMYWKLTQDTPEGDIVDLRQQRRHGRDRQEGWTGPCSSTAMHPTIAAGASPRPMAPASGWSCSSTTS